MKAESGEDLRKLNGMLVVVAAPKEREAVLRGLGGELHEVEGPWRQWERGSGSFGRVMVVESGVGKANAAGATAWALSKREGESRAPFGLVLSLGIAGTLDPSVAIGSAVIATASGFADEGLVDSAGFTPARAMGFPIMPATAEPAGVVSSGESMGASFGGAEGSDSDLVVTDAEWSGRFASRCARLETAGLESGSGAVVHRGPIATVSVCSGTDAAARAVGDRVRLGGQRALAEAMEGAAVGLVAARAGVAFAEVRVISNTTGERGRQRWALAEALGVLDSVASVLGPEIRGG